MIAEEFADLVRREQAKREACWNPLQRWRVLQQMITWAEAQTTLRRNTPQTCLRLERAKLARLQAAPGPCGTSQGD